MWDDTNKIFYYQVGIGNGNSQIVSDHDIWRLPQADDNYQGCTSNYRYICHRPVFVNPAAVSAGAIQAGALISPNLAGRLAADLALCYHAYHDLANTTPSGNLLTAIPYSFYPEAEWRDDINGRSMPDNRQLTWMHVGIAAWLIYKGQRRNSSGAL